MLGPKTENSVTDSQDVNQVGHNSGTMNIGLTFEQHERNVRELLAKSEALYERLLEAKDRTSRAELAEALAQRDAARTSLSNLQADYQKTLAELADLKATLARYDNVLDRTKHAAALAALSHGDRSSAQALLIELSGRVRARREVLSSIEAKLEFRLGQIASTDNRWQAASEHFAISARLVPQFYSLMGAHLYAFMAGKLREATAYSAQFVSWAETEGTSGQLVAALFARADTMIAMSEFDEATSTLKRASQLTFDESDPAYSYLAKVLVLKANLLLALERANDFSGSERQVWLQYLEGYRDAIKEVNFVAQNDGAPGIRELLLGIVQSSQRAQSSSPQ